MTISFLPLCIALLVSAVIPVGAQDQYSLPACASQARSRKFVGESLRLYLPTNAIVRHGSDVDYSNYSVGFGKKKARVWLRGISGPNATSGKVSQKQLSDSTSVSKRFWKFGEAEGEDVRGTLPNGNFWRFIGQYGEQVEYYDVPKDAAEYFDSILDKLCYQA